MSFDDTRGRRGGGDDRRDNNERPRSGFRRESGGYRRDTTGDERGPRRDDTRQGEGQTWRPFPPREGGRAFEPRGGRPFEPRTRDGGRPFERQGGEQRGGSDRQERDRFQGPGTARPPYRENRGGEPFGERPPYRENRTDDAPRDRPPFRDRDTRTERPSYRQGRGGYRSFDQETRGGDRYNERERSGGFGRQNEGDRRPSFGGDRPRYGGSRPTERRDEGSPFEGQGRPLGTSTRMGRSPVSQFERIQADVYGRWPVLESLRANNVVKIYMAAGVNDSADHLREIQTLAAERHITITRVDRFALDKVLGNVNHQGIAAACRPFQYTPLEDIMAAAQRDGNKPLLVLFDGVQDPQNVGSILRTAEAVGVDGAVLARHNQAGVTPAVVRASAGAVEHLSIAEVTNLRQSVETLKEAGYWIVGLDMEGGTDYDNFDVASPIALVVGGEGRGLSRMVAENCDYLVRLPMHGQVSSLNASVAAGVVLFEIERRRRADGTGKSARKPAGASKTSQAVEEPRSEPSTDVVARVASTGDPEHDLEAYLDEDVEAGTSEGASQSNPELAANEHSEDASHDEGESGRGDDKS